MQLHGAPSKRYRLADHVRACRIDEQVVLLDMRRDKYLGIGGAQLAALSQVITDWPADRAQQPTLAAASLGKWTQTLIDQRMLTDALPARPRITTLPEPTQSLDPDIDARRSSPVYPDLFNLAWSSFSAALWIRRRCIADIASSVARLRSRNTAGGASANADHLQASVSSYMRLRPFMFTAHDKCLHDSLTLVRFLSREGIFPTWVIGVRTKPFAAHSWVQSGHLVLNDVHEHVRTYAPILVV